MRSLIDPRIPLSARARIVYLCLVVASAIAIGSLFFLFEQQRTKLNSEIAQVARLAIQNNRALCLRKVEEERAVEDGKAYLRSHPKGSKDIPLSLIRKAIRDDEAVLATLADVTCPPPPST